MILSLTCLSTGLGDYDSEYVLDADESKFLFNVRDGTQRLCSEHAIRLSRVKAIFISRLSPHTLGGLPGMLLSIYDMGLHELTIYGPEGLGEYISTLQLFIFRTNYRITVIEIEKDISSIDLHNGAIIHPFVLSPTQTTEFRREIVHQQSYVNLTLSLIRRETPCYQSEISYIIDIPTIPGKFCPQKAKELGIPSGPLYKELASGSSITIQDRVITSDMVMTSSSRGPSVCLLNVHSKAIAIAMETAIETIVQSFTSSLLAVYLNIHPTYTVHLPELPKNVKFFSLPSGYKPIIHTASTFVCKRLHALFPTLFPDCEITETMPKPQNNHYPIITRSTMKLAPLKGQGVVVYPTITNDQPAIRSEEEKTSELYTSLLKQESIPSFQGKVTFLGTGSAVPSKYRNVSSLLYQLPQCSILLDCGEGTLNQLLRLFSPTILTTIRMIVISHSHADHHLGLPLLFDCMYETLYVNDENEKRLKIDREPILLFAPRRVKVFLDQVAKSVPWIQEMFTFIEIHHDFFPIFNPSVDVIPDCVQSLQETHSIHYPESVRYEKVETGRIHFSIPDYKIDLSFFPMVHCDDASAVLIHSSSEDVLFTGDGRPAHQFHNYFDASTNVDVLINESTFTRERQEHAEQKKHCTMEEALSFASSIHAKYTILTHFSQRYPKNLSHDQGLKVNATTSLEERAGNYQTFVCAHDLMTIDFKDLQSLCTIRDAFEDCFVDDDDFSVFNKHKI